MHKPHNHCLEGLLPSQKPLNKSWRCQHHNCQVQALHGAKQEETDSAGPSNKTKQKPHQPQHPGHTKCSSKIIWPCKCTDLRTMCNQREQTLLQASTSPTAGIFWKVKPRKYFCINYHKRDDRARTWTRGLLEHSWMSIRCCHPSVKVAPRQKGKHPVKLKHFLEGKLFSQVTQAMQCWKWNWDSEERHIIQWVISAAWTWGNILQFNLWMCSRKPLPLLYSVYLSTEFLSQPSTAGK